MYDYDITGLLECSVNGLAHVLFPASKRGGHRSPWNCQDEWIIEVAGSKELGHHTSPGMEVFVEEV
jgi:hypothetical protein